MKQNLIASLSITLLATSASASVLTYEGFDYTASDSLNGKSGGSGWRSPSNPTWDTSSGTYTITDGGLSYSDAGYTSGAPTTSGNAAFSSGSSRSERIPDVDASGVWDNAGLRNASSNLIGGSGVNGTVFGSFLISSSDWSTSRFILEFQNTGGGVQPRFDIDGTNGFRLTNTSGGALSNSPFAPTGSNTYLVAFQIDFVGTDTTTASNTNASTISFWVNPEAASTPPAIGNAATEGRQIFSTSRELLEFNRIDLRSISGDSTIDELRFGTTWGDVAPIPEPSAYGLIAGFLALGWVMVRRRS